MKCAGLAFVAVIALAHVALGEARADEPRSTCDEAFEASELQLRPGETHLLEARASLRACAMPTCQAWMVDDCAKRLAAVEPRIPSLAFSADDGRGTPIYDVRVREGDRELAARIDGRATEVEPGPHTFVAEHGDARVSLDVVAIEGKRAQQIVFSFPAPSLPGSSAGTPAPSTTMVLAHPWARPLAVGLVGGGIVALGLGTGFGIAALTKKSNADCVNDVCRGSPDGALAAAHASTAAFVVGGVLVAAGAVTFFAFGRTQIQASPGGMHIGGAW